MEKELLGSLELEFLINNPELLAELRKAETNVQATTARVEANIKQANASLQTSTARSTEAMKIQAAQYQQAADLAVDPQRRAKLNQLAEQTAQAAQRMGNAGKKGFDELGNSIKSGTTLMESMRSTLNKLAVSLGAIWLVNKVIEFGSAVLGVTKQAEGVERAFKRINSPDLLDQLREATRGTVSDLALMQKAVLANQFNFPVDKLAAFYEFAQKRARDLGADTEQYVNDIISGTARGSVRILDNLGISQTEVRAEVKKTGDFVTAVYNIIQRELKKTGEEADTTADHMGRITATVTNIQENIGKNSGGIINSIAGLVEQYLHFLEVAVQDTDQRLTALGTKFATQDNAKQLASYRSDTPENREKSKRVYQEMIAQQEQKLADYDRKIKDTQDSLNIFQRIGRTVFTDLDKQQQIDRDNQLTYLAELKGELASLEGIDDETSRKKKQQAQLDEQNAAKERASLKQKRDILMQIHQLTAEYGRKGMSDEDAQIQGIIDKFDRLRAIIKDFNADPKNKNNKINAGILLPVQQKAIDNQYSLQDFDYYKQDLEKQKKLYDDFEAYKNKVGSAKAKERYQSDLQGFNSFVEYLQFELSPERIDPNDKTAGTAKRKELLQQQLNEALAAQRANYDQLLASLKTYETERENITATYLDKRQRLVDKQAYDEIKVLDEQYNQQIGALDDANLEKLESVKELYSGINNMSRNSAKQLIADVQAELNARIASGKITAAEAKKIQDLIDKSNQSLDNRVPEGLKVIASNLSNLANAAGQFNDNLGRAVQSVAVLVSATADIKQNMSVLTNSKSSLLDKIGSGIGIVGAAVGVISGIVSYFSNSKQRAAQMQYEADLQVKATEAVNKALERQLALTNQLYGPERISGYLKQLNDIKVAQNDLNNQLNGKFTLTGIKVVDDEIAKLNSGQDYNRFVLSKQVLDGLHSTALKAGASLEDLQKLLDQGKLDAGTANIVQI